MRLFIAIGLDDPVKDLLCRAQRQLERQALGGRFSRRENLHLTLAFLGQAPRISAGRRWRWIQIQAAPFFSGCPGAGLFPICRRADLVDGHGPVPPFGGPAPPVVPPAAGPRLFAGRPAFSALTPTLGRGIRLPAGFDSQALARQLGGAVQRVACIRLMESTRRQGLLCYEERYRRPLCPGLSTFKKRMNPCCM